MKKPQPVEITAIGSITFECGDATIQYSNGLVRIWPDGDTSRHPLLTIESGVLRGILQVGEEQCSEN